MLAINMDDVVSVLKSCAPYLIFFGVVLVLAIVAMIVCKGMKKPAKYLVRTQAAVAAVLALVIAGNLICVGPMSTMLSLISGKGVISDETSAQAEALVTEIANEGIVLLENDGALPLAADASLNVFGWASTNPCYGGTGSGALNDAYHTVSLLEGLANAGIKTNSELSDFYTAYRADRPVVGMWAQDWTLPEPTAASYTDELMSNAKSFSDTAMVVITRVGGEGADLPTDMSQVTYTDNSPDYKDFADGEHFLQLTQTEKDMLELVCGSFDKVVVVYNGANAMELGFTQDYDQIKSVIWCPGTGQTGFNALGSILTGETNPSGRTTDTFVYDLTATPAYNNAGSFVYDNMDEFGVESTDKTTKEKTVAYPSFVNYVEGIYVGYRYYETAAAEGVIDYDKSVLYPFGYGISYTEFTQKMGAITDNSGVLSFDVTVTNTGSVAGKDVVEVYYEPPYENGGIEKASANLIAFDKTGVIEPGQSETVTISFNAEDMASFDANGAGCYVLERGDYVISINADSHTALDAKTYTVNSTVTYGGDNARSTDAVAAVSLMADVAGDVTYLSRADGFTNYDAVTAAPKSLSISDAHMAEFYNVSNYDPAAENDDSDVMPTTGAKNGMTLADLRGADYDDPQWEPLLDQLTVEDMDMLIARGGYSTAAAKSVGKLSTIDCDGPASINNNFTGVGSIGFPSAVMIAATWNTDLAESFGDSIGTMANEMGVSGWYAPAMNIHRTAFAGRNFEYYSEDGLLSGKIAARAIVGAQNHGVYAYMKHFALNDQEINRCNMLCTWTDEQAAREIYLKSFELAVKEGGSQAVMSSFNYIGTTWAGAYSPVMNDVLRDEWGFRGMVLTDYFGVYGYMDADQAIRGGTDFCLAPMDNATNHLTDTTSATSLQAARTASKNIMYTVVNSRAYDPANIQTGLESWQIVMIVVDVIAAAALVAFEVVVVRKGLKKRSDGTVDAPTGDK